MGGLGTVLNAVDRTIVVGLDLRVVVLQAQVMRRDVDQSARRREAEGAG